MRVCRAVLDGLLEYSRWHDAPRWSAWVELECADKAGVTHAGTVAAWLPWNRPARRVSPDESARRARGGN
jgi:hypothetical protein